MRNERNFTINEHPTGKISMILRTKEWKLRGIVTLLRAIPLAISLVALCAAGAIGAPAQDQNQLPPEYVPSGAAIYSQYCASCHGTDAKGNGPVKKVLRKPAPDLTTLAKRHGGKFPYPYVVGVLRFSPGISSHGSGDMPMWGPLFEYYYNQNSAQQRIRNLCDFLAALQVK